MAELNPLAQTFQVPEASIITKVDLYFYSKDTDIPARIHLRSNSTAESVEDSVIPGSEGLLYPGDITTSSDGSVATTFVFPDPIYLGAGWYTLCLGSASENYRVFVSRMGGVDLIDGNRIDDQPYVGVLRKAANEADWRPIDTDDLKFKLYRAKFSTNQQADIDFHIKSNQLIDTGLSRDPFEIYPNSTTMRVYHTNHGMTDGTHVRFLGIEGASGIGGTSTVTYNIDPDDLEGEVFQIADATLHTYTITLPNATSGVTEPTRWGGLAIKASKNFTYDSLYPIAASIVDANAKVIRSVKRTSTDFTVSNTYETITDDTNQFDYSGVITGEVSKEHDINDAESLVYRLNLTTSSEYVSPIVDLQRVGVVGVRNLINNPTYATETALTFDEETVLSAVSTTFTAVDGNTSQGIMAIPVAARDEILALKLGTYVEITSTGTTNDGQYRLVDVNADGSEITLAKVNGTAITSNTDDYTIVAGLKFVAEEAATGGSAQAKYLTRQVDFVNPSTAINVRLDVNRPTNTDIELYYKAKPVGIQTGFDKKEFTKIDYDMPVSLNEDFTEIEALVEGIEEYDGIIFKIVLLSDNSAIIPRAKNLRLIALAT